MIQTCIGCQIDFEISQEDELFYQKISPTFQGKKFAVPTPQTCPDCRQKRRQAFRNERKIYHNTCAMCTKDFLSMYSPDKKQTVYCSTCWWSDDWDALEYSRDFDFSRSFFEQWNELWRSIPKLGIMAWGDNVNCDYTNDIVRSKNCYLVFDGEQGEDSYYGETFNLIKDSIDFLFLKESELCYECVNCLNCYNLKYSQFSQNCSDSYFLLDCLSCKNCYGCVNLNNKEYHIFNKPYSPIEYKKFITELNLGNFEKRERAKTEALKFFQSQPRRAFRGRMNENTRGNNVNNCQNAYECFDCNELRDGRYCTNMMLPATDCCDTDSWGENTSLIYNSVMTGIGAQQIIGTHYAGFNANDIYHSAYCWHSCTHLFGCVNLRHKEYCILNKQYSKEEYLGLVPKIIAHMQNTGEWAEFFPPELSTFGYNETVANEYFPLTREQALDQGFLWCDFEAPIPTVKKVLTSIDLPLDIKDVTDEILDFAITCSVTNRLFRITKHELLYYRTHTIPLPRLHPDQRHTDRMNLRPPRKLYTRSCAECQIEIITPYSKERTEKVLCEQCYLKVIK